MKNNFYNQFSARGMRGFVLGFMLLMGLNAFGQGTYYSGPSSTLASGTTATCLNWGTTPGGPYTASFIPTSSSPNSIVIQNGHSVTSSGSSQNYNDITIEGTGALTIGSSSTFGCYGNFSITGAGKFDNSSGNTVRLVMLTSGKTISGTAASGVGGISIGNSSSANMTIKLNANTSIGGRIAVGQSGLTAYNNTLDLNGFNLSAESLIVYLATSASAPNNVKNNKVKASGVETLTLNSAATSIVYFDLTTPGTTNKLGTLTQNSASNSLTLGTAATVGTLNLTAGKITLGTNDLTVDAITGGSSTAYVVTNSTGVLKRTATGSSAALFPIGTTADYLPVTITNTGTSDDFTAKVSSGAPSCVPLITSINAVWDLVEGTAGGSVATVRMEYSNTGLRGGTYDPLVAKAVHCNGSTVVDKSATGGEAGTGPFYTQVTGVTTFSPFGISSDPSVLPVELTNFQAKSNQKSALLTWTTASEKDNALFNIEQSTNGTNFQTVGQVKGHGTTSASSSYNFEHMTPSVGINYYRLQQVDFNGTTSYSAVRSVLFGKTGLVIKSTLVQDALDIVTNDDTAPPLSIFNLSGQAVFTGKVQGAQRLNVSTLPAGLYIVRTATGDVARFVKQ